MKLRTRLTLVLLLLSVVPLGTVTIYSYVNNKATLEQAAAREADLLASELTARMQLITAELSNRVGRLMDMQTARAELVPVSAELPRPPAPRTQATKSETAQREATRPEAQKSQATKQAADAAASSELVSMETQVASTLGEAAMLLNSVELQGGRGFGFRPRPPGSPGSVGGVIPPDGLPSRASRGQSAGQNVQGRRNTPNDRAGGAGAAGALPTPPPAPASATGAMVPPAASTSTGTSTSTTAAATPPAAGNASTPVTTSGATPQAQVVPVVPVPPSTASAVPDPNRIVIDMGAISRDIVKKMIPAGTANMTVEERQRVSREMGMRIMGITEGLKLGAAELQKKADAARLKAQEDAKQAEAAHPAEADAGPTQTKTALKGSTLGVTVERNGKVVHAVSAEINLDQVLMTVFSTTKRDRGEVPFAVAKDGKLYTAVAADKSVVATFGPAIRPNGPVGETILPEWIVMTTNDPSGSGLRFGIARPVGDSMNDLRHRAERNAGLGLVLIALALVGVVPVSTRLTRNLSTLTEGVENISRGDFSTRVRVQSNDEIGVLAAAFNQMAADVETHQRSLVSQERLKRELELGRQIQNEMLPHEPLRIGLMEVKGVSVPAREVGGDFFNYFTLSSGEVALLLGDVSGKGVGAALVMANIQATLRTRLAIEQDLTVITDAIDRELEKSTRAAYATLIVGIYSPITKRIRYVNAGHNPQFVLRAGGGLDQMSSTGTPVGLLSGRGYEQGTLQLASGDFIFFYTDGLVEAENELGEFFGPERLEAVLLDAHKASDGSIDVVFGRVKAAIAEFSGAREPFDDATMMAVRIG